MQPLMGMLMVHMRDVGSGMQDAELDVITQVAVIDVRGIVRKERLGRLRFGRWRLLPYVAG